MLLICLVYKISIHNSRGYSALASGVYNCFLLFSGHTGRTLLVSSIGRTDPLITGSTGHTIRWIYWTYYLFCLSDGQPPPYQGVLELVFFIYLQMTQAQLIAHQTAAANAAARKTASRSYSIKYGR